AHFAQWMILLARTDTDAPKHRGISFFLLDMQTPGITIRPLVDMLGRHTFNQVFFDNVFVPRDCLVGEENRGWYVGTTTLDFERSSIGGSATSRRAFDDMVKDISARRRLNARERAALAQMRIEIDVARWIAYRVASLQTQGKVPNYEASMSKVFGSEVGQRLASVALHLYGQVAQLAPQDPRAPVHGHI